MLGISINSPEANRSFAKKLGLKFPLLCDTRKQVCHQYGVLSFLRIPKRTTFVIDAEGIIRHINRGRDALNPARVHQTCALQMPRPE